MNEPLLVRLGTTRLEASTGRFAAADKFVLNEKSRDLVVIVTIQDQFNRWFLAKTEGPRDAVVLEWQELQRNAGDPLLVSELGGPKLAETSLSEVFALLQTQRAGQAGVLATNGWGNVFYVKDVAGTLRAVYVHWCDDGWAVEASVIGREAEWPIRDRVFSRYNPSSL